VYDKHGRVRKKRRSWNEPGHAHELTFTCMRRWPMLAKDRTRTWFIESLENARRKWNFAIWALCDNAGSRARTGLAA
jgi:putative transposase